MKNIKKFALLFVLVCCIILCMSLFNWGSLPKDQTNPQLITEAITEAIIAHEQDPTSHLGAGESIEQHKNNEVLDHLAFSVLDDKMAYDGNSIDLEMGILTPYAHTAGVEINGIKTWYINSANSSSPQNIYGSVGDMAQISEFAFSLNPRIITEILVTAITSQEGYILVGETDEGNGFGFKILNDKLYGVYFDSSNVAHTVEIKTLVANTVYKLEARVTSGNTIIFLIDNVDSGSFDAVDLDITMTVMPSIPWVDFRSTTTTSRSLYIRGFYWEAELSI